MRQQKKDGMRMLICETTFSTITWKQETQNQQCIYVNVNVTYYLPATRVGLLHFFCNNPKITKYVTSVEENVH